MYLSAAAAENVDDCRDVFVLAAAAVALLREDGVDALLDDRVPRRIAAVLIAGAISVCLRQRERQIRMEFGSDVTQYEIIIYTWRGKAANLQC